MDHPKDNSESRRRFLLAGGRLLALGGLTSFVLTQEAKRGRLANDPNCIKLYTCKECIEFGRCAKPKAEHFRSSQGQPRNSNS